jgi:hypothetical protein
VTGLTVNETTISAAQVSRWQAHAASTKPGKLSPQSVAIRDMHALKFLELHQ